MLDKWPLVVVEVLVDEVRLERREVMLTNAIVLPSACHNTVQPPNGINLIQNLVSNCIIIIINKTFDVGDVQCSAKRGLCPPRLRDNNNNNK